MPNLVRCTDFTQYFKGGTFIYSYASVQVPYSVSSSCLVNCSVLTRDTLFSLDIDECVVRTHNCGMGFECLNTDGSFKCNSKQRCLTGFTEDSHGNCIGKTGQSNLESHLVPPIGGLHENYLFSF